ncbi:MAG: hypothetical protein GXP47_03985 [Acidobacteria bacterium]|nr:hypothetical protein [Acidobacteriota bacterium]
MIRLIKRYGSRKLYDTEESRYVSLEELAGWIRHGQEIRVIDNKTGEDVTSQTLTQIISEEGRRGTALLPNDLLHELIRLGEEAVTSSVGHVQTKVDQFVRASIDRLAPVRKARDEMERLKERLSELESALAELEHEETLESQPVRAHETPARASHRSPTKKTSRGGSGKARATSRPKKASSA